MSVMFKATHVYYDQRDGGCWKKGNDENLNLDHVVRFHKYDLSPIKKEDGISTVFVVETTIDNQGYSLKVMSPYLKQIDDRLDDVEEL
jgi:hypothetical protein